VMHRSRAARRYARALLDLARERGVLDGVREDMARLGALVADEPLAARFLGNYTLGRPARARVLERAFAPHVQPLVARFLRFVEARRRLAMLPQICARFRELHDQAMGIVRGRVTSAFPLAAPELAALGARMRAVTRCAVELSAGEDRALLGGLQARVGDRLHDLSVAGRLRRLRRAWLPGEAS
jgi:F-type H+-transporting ATPase subunit delta